MPLRPRIARQRSRAAAADRAASRAVRPSSSSRESQPMIEAPRHVSHRVDRRPPPPSRRANSLTSEATESARTASSSMPDTITSGRRPAARSVRSRAGEAEAKINFTTLGSHHEPERTSSAVERVWSRLPGGAREVLETGAVADRPADSAAGSGPDPGAADRHRHRRSGGGSRIVSSDRPASIRASSPGCRAGSGSWCAGRSSRGSSCRR